MIIVLMNLRIYKNLLDPKSFPKLSIVLVVTISGNMVTSSKQESTREPVASVKALQLETYYSTKAVI